jgi:hypothetical protein
MLTSPVMLPCIANRALSQSYSAELKALAALIFLGTQD